MTPQTRYCNGCGNPMKRHATLTIWRCLVLGCIQFDRPYYEKRAAMVAHEGAVLHAALPPASIQGTERDR